jgi:predicted RND superfamily exporter protein
MKKLLLIFMLASVSMVSAQTVVFRQSTDTLKLVCRNNQNVESWQWYKNNIAISGATDSVLFVVVDSTSATKSVYYCQISNGVENKKVGDWTIERKANGRTVSRKNKYR